MSSSNNEADDLQWLATLHCTQHNVCRTVSVQASYFYLSMFLKEVVLVSMNGIDDFGKDRRQPVSYRQICKRSLGEKNKIKTQFQALLWSDYIMILTKHQLTHVNNTHSVYDICDITIHNVHFVKYISLLNNEAGNAEYMTNSSVSVYHLYSFLLRSEIVFCFQFVDVHTACTCAILFFLFSPLCLIFSSSSVYFLLFVPPPFLYVVLIGYKM